MKKFLDSIGSLFATLLIIGLTGLYFWGLIHSYQKHSTKVFVLDICLPPLAVYRGAESFWHKTNDNTSEFSSTQWDQRINNDLIDAIELVNISSTSTDVSTELKEDLISKFRDKVKEYPEDKRQLIKNGCKAYIIYSMSLLYDLEQHLNNMYNYDDTTELSASEATTIYYDSLYKFYKISEMPFLKTQIDSGMKQAFYHNGKKWSKTELSAFIDKTSQLKPNYKQLYKAVYKEMFDDEISL